MINLANQLFFIEEKMRSIDLLTQFLRYGYCKKVIKNHFNKNLVMSVEDERIFQASNKCWICKKLFTDEDKKVRDHDHITGKYRDSAHPNCNINLKLNKKVPAIFRNLRDYDGHLVMQ